MSTHVTFFHKLLAGAVSGIAGGLISGLLMRQLGLLESMAALVDSGDGFVGLALHVGLMALLGMIFAVVIWQQCMSAAEMLIWGMAYGAIGWVIWPVMLFPLLLNGQLDWSLSAAQSQVPLFITFIIYGMGLGLSIVWFREERIREDAYLTIGSLVRAVLAGLIGAGVVILLVQQLNFPLELILIGAALAGFIYVLLDPGIETGAGVSTIKGLLFGFAAWVVVDITLLQMSLGEELGWSAGSLGDSMRQLIGYLLFGSLLGWSYHVMSRVSHRLFGDGPHIALDEGMGTRALRILAWGVIAGLFAGLIYAALLIQIDGLSTISVLIGSSDLVAGLALHLLIAVVLGVTYGALFQGRAHDAGSALGWGVSYGFIWWILGPLTLMPLLLGTDIDWSGSRVAGLFPYALGHIVYGAAVGLIYYLFESQYRPWWASKAELTRERIEFREAQARTAAPALWLLVVVIALLLSILIA